MSEHVCHCRGCAPDGYYPDEPKQGPHHIAIRFGDRWYQVILNGEPVHRATEALAGENGYVIELVSGEVGGRLPGKHRCRACLRVESVCEHVARGRVEIALTERP